VYRFSLAEVNGLEISHHADGTGSIRFLDVWLPLGEDNELVNPSLSRLPDLDLALTIAYAAADQAGVPPQDRPTALQMMGRVLTGRLGCHVVGSALAVVACLGATILVSIAAAAEGWALGHALQPWVLIQEPRRVLAAVGLMFATGFLGFWSFALRERLRRYPHLQRLRRILAWLQGALALFWLGVAAWAVLFPGD
jgi:hypothetical protein